MENATAEINIEEASTSLAADILGNDSAPDDTLDDAIDKGASTDKDDTGDEKTDDTAKADIKSAPADKANGKDAAAHAAIEALPVPESWKKEMHEHWGKMPRPAQEYYLEREKQMKAGLDGFRGDAEFGRSLRNVVSKHQDILQSQGLDAARAVEYLLNTHRSLSSGTPEQKQAHIERIAKTYGITFQQAAAAAGVDAEGKPLPVAQTPPEVKAAMDRLDRIESALTREQEQRFNAVRVQTAADVEAFASDPAHPYFDECADDIAKFVRAGEKLESAYEKAVWANPVTRQKEISRIQQETEKANAEKVKEAAKAAKRATSSNVKGRDTNRAPTEGRATMANMDEVLRETYAEIKSRA